MHFRRVFQCLVSVRAVFRHKQHAAIVCAQLCTKPFSVGWRVGPEIEHDVTNRSPRTPDQLCLKRRFGLEVHPSNRSFPDAEAHVRLNRHEVNAVIGEFACTPGSHEPSPIIFVRSGVDYEGASDSGLGETHAPNRSPSRWRAQYESIHQS